MPVAVEVERSGARRPRQRCFAGQRHSDFRGEDLSWISIVAVGVE